MIASSCVLALLVCLAGGAGLHSPHQNVARWADPSPPACVADQTCCPADAVVCAQGSKFTHACQQWTQCALDAPDYINWPQNANHSCTCGPDGAGVDCSLVAPPDTAPNGTESWCPEEEHWDGSVLPLPRATKHMQCFLDADGQVLLSIRLHRIDVLLGPAGSDTMQWILSSRHRNESVTNRSDPLFHLCGPMGADLSCALSQCTAFKAQADGNCTDIIYSCAKASCSSNTTLGMMLIAAQLNDPKNWPLKAGYTDVNLTSGASVGTLYTSQITLKQHCITGTCVPLLPGCNATYITPASYTQDYIILSSVIGGCLIAAIAVITVGYIGRRPATDDFQGGAGKGMSSIVVSSEPLGIVFEDVSYTVTLSPRARMSWARYLTSCFRRLPVEKREVLHSVTGIVAPGEVVALMGPSGSGKSSLLDILAGHDKSGGVRGLVEYFTKTERVNARGEEGVGAAHSTMPGIGYVYQDDSLLPSQTVREALTFSAEMRLPRHVSSQTLKALVTSTLTLLDLHHIANSRIGSPDAGGGISGGERKRVAIGVELVAQPRLLLLDEPTTGLDSVSTKVVLGVLHRIAAAGCAVILSIHQPTSRVFRSFHKVVCLSATGHTLYVGPPMEAVGHVVSSLQLPAPRLPAGTDFSVEDAEADFDAALLAALGEEEAKKDVVVNVSAPEAPAGERESSPTMGLRRRRVASSPRADDALSPKLSNSSSSPDLGTLRVAAYRALDDEGEQEEEPATPSAMVNPAELLLDVAANRDASSGLKAAAAFRRTARHTHTLATIRDTCNRCRPAAAPEPSGGALVWVAKFLLLVGRGGRQMRREPMLFWLQLVLTCAVAVVIGLLFFHLNWDLTGIHNRTGVLFFNTIYFALASMSSIGVLIVEKHTFFRERARGYYTTGAYFASKVIADVLPLRVLPPILFAAVSYYMIRLNDDAPTKVMLFTVGLVLVNVASAASCYVISTAFSSAGKANLAASLYFVFNVLFGGVLLTARTSAITGIMYLSIVNFAFQILMINEFHGVSDINFNPQTDGQHARSVIITGDTWLLNWGIDPLAHPGLLMEAAGALCAYIALLLSAAYLLLAFFTRYVK